MRQNLEEKHKRKLKTLRELEYSKKPFTLPSFRTNSFRKSEANPTSKTLQIRFGICSSS
jgi:hypothetical protein